MRSQKPWRKRKVEVLGAHQMQQLLSQEAVDFVSLFRGCALESTDEKISRIIKERRREVAKKRRLEIRPDTNENVVTEIGEADVKLARVIPTIENPVAREAHVVIRPDDTNENVVTENKNEIGEADVKLARVIPTIENPVARETHVVKCFAPRNLEYYTQPDFGFEILVPFELYPHQIQAIKWARHREQNPLHGIRGGILSLEMGLGKTLVALSLIMSENYAPNMIVCNKSLLGSIAQDTKKFFGDRLPFFILHKDKMKLKLDDLEVSWFQNKKFILTTYDVLVELGKRAGILGSKRPSRTKKLAGDNFFATRFHRVICDESQRFVNPKSQVYKCLQQIKCNYRLCLTGTPIRNYDYDLHTQLSFCGLDPKAKWSQTTYKELGLRQAIHCVSMEQANIKLPEKQIIQLDLDFTETERSVYKSIYKNSVDTFTSFNAGNTNFAAVLLQFLRLRQVCIAPYMINDKKDISVTLDRKLHGFCSTKMLRTVQIVKDIPKNEKVLIFSSFTSALSLVQDALKYHLNMENEVVMVHGGTSGKKREVLFDNFREEEDIRVLLITNNVGCMGLNLTEANHVILLETWWNDTVGDQAAARAWRIGQTKKVYIWRLIMKNSIEERMLTMCQSKNDMTDSYLKEVPLNKEMLLEIFQK